MLRRRACSSHEPVFLANVPVTPIARTTRSNMSLGMNTMRARSRTNLPGAIGNAVGLRRIATSPKQGRTPSQARAESRTVAPSPLAAPSLPRDVSSSSPRETTPDEDDRHFVYSSAAEDLKDVHTGDVVARTGDLVMLVYPMQEGDGANSGEVLMRVKAVDCTTGQLSYHWVVVYDIDSGKRCISEFSFGTGAAGP
jgi:hypothetical protein